MFQIELVSVSKFVGLLLMFRGLHENFKVIIVIFIITIQVFILHRGFCVMGVKLQGSAIYGEAFCHKDVDPVLFVILESIVVQIVDDLGSLCEEEVFTDRYKLGLDSNVGTQLLDQISLAQNLPDFLSSDNLECLSHIGEATVFEEQQIVENQEAAIALRILFEGRLDYSLLGFDLEPNCQTAVFLLMLTSFILSFLVCFEDRCSSQRSPIGFRRL